MFMTNHHRALQILLLLDSGMLTHHHIVSTTPYPVIYDFCHDFISAEA